MRYLILFFLFNVFNVSAFSQSNTETQKTKDSIIVEKKSPKDALNHGTEYDSVYSSVDIKAEFPGGLNGWIKYLERNIGRDIPYKNGAPSGKYTVILSFEVAKDGTISKIQAETDPGYGSKEEALRLLSNSPKWKPAIQNGRNVIYRHKQSITFLVN